MHKNFQALVLSYKSASVEVRERFALTEAQSRELLVELKETLALQDLLILSTCNRTEIYFSSFEPIQKAVLSIFATIKGESLENVANYFQLIEDHDIVVQHLFDVSIGLESQVVGDLQIINQVKSAYQLTADANAAGPFLHRLLHTIFFANKRVTTETAFRDGAASVSYAAMELAEDLALQVHNPNVLILGLGEIGSDVARNFKGSVVTQISLCNRTLEKSKELSIETGFQVVNFEQLNEAVHKADIIISSVSAGQPTITPSILEGRGMSGLKFLIDLSIPRSVAPECEQMAGVLVYNVDQINAKVSQSQRDRIASIPMVKTIIEEALIEFNNWSQEMVVSPTINKLKIALEQIRQEEMSRHIKHLTEEQNEMVEKITRSMMQRIIKLPVLQLKAACKRGEAETLIDVLNDLFNLEKVEETSSSH